MRAASACVRVCYMGVIIDKRREVGEKEGQGHLFVCEEVAAKARTCLVPSKSSGRVERALSSLSILYPLR